MAASSARSAASAHLVITASAETPAGLPGAPPAELAGVGPIPIETAQRHACDPSVSWLLGQAELDNETGRHAHRQIPAATRLALVCGATGAGQRPLGLIRRYPSGTFT